LTGLYNSLFGVNPGSAIVLKILKAEGLGSIPRFRDAYIEFNEDTKKLEFVVFTRTGGGNREEYEGENDAMASHSLYLRDKDDDFDSTYAYFWFKVPEKYESLVASVYEEVGAKPAFQDAFNEKLEEIKRLTPEQMRSKFPEICDVLDKATGATKSK